MYISQQELGATIESLRNYVYFPMRFSIFGLSVSKGTVNDYSPRDCFLLEPQGHVEPTDSVQAYTNMVGNEIDQLPDNQALEELTKTIDYLNEKRRRLERASEGAITTGS